MKKQRLLSTVLAFGLLTTLSSCSFDIWTIIDNIVNGTTSYNDGGNKDYVTYGTPKYGSDFSADNLTNKNLGLGMGSRYLPSTGNSKILVVPVATSDCSFTSTQLTMIKNAFFGSANQTGWESVASFYEKSSYGKLHITGEVTSVVTLSNTAAALEKSVDSIENGAAVYTADILDKALESVSSKIDLTQYDTDSDGYIDAVWMVYAPAYQAQSDLWWAFTTWTSRGGLHDGKKACLYAWASVDFLTEYDYAGVLGRKEEKADAHTFIHETGHMLGLDDYYSYDYQASGANKCLDTPMGGVDMMDFNIGDHCAFSKYLLEWVKPTVITKEYLEANNYKLTLKSQTDTGNFFILPVYNSSNTAQYNNTAFDEYLIMEYYTNTGLNKADSEHKYTNGLATYNTTGVLLYHINATVGKITATRTGDGVWDGNAYDKLPPYSTAWGGSYTYTYLYNNTKSYSWEQSLDDSGMSFYRGRLISLLPATGNRINGGSFSGTSSLYRKGASFNSTKYSTFVFDDGSKPKFGFTVDSISSNDCVVSFSEF